MNSVEDILEDLFTVFSTLGEARTLKKSDNTSKEEADLRLSYIKLLFELKTTLIELRGVLNFQQQVLDVDVELEPKEYFLAFYERLRQNQRIVEENLELNKSVPRPIGLQDGLVMYTKELKVLSHKIDKVYRDLKELRSAKE